MKAARRRHRRRRAAECASLASSPERPTPEFAVERRILEFGALLRRHGLRISPAETLDALSALGSTGLRLATGSSRTFCARRWSSGLRTSPPSTSSSTSTSPRSGRRSRRPAAPPEGGGRLAGRLPGAPREARGVAAPEGERAGAVRARARAAAERRWDAGASAARGRGSSTRAHERRFLATRSCTWLGAWMRDCKRLEVRILARLERVVISTVEWRDQR